MKQLTHKEVASRGGRSTVKKYGKQHMSTIAKKAMSLRWCKDTCLVCKKEYNHDSSIQLDACSREHRTIVRNHGYYDKDGKLKLTK